MVRTQRHTLSQVPSYLVPSESKLQGLLWVYDHLQVFRPQDRSQERRPNVPESFRFSRRFWKFAPCVLGFGLGSHSNVRLIGSRPQHPSYPIYMTTARVHATRRTYLGNTSDVLNGRLISSSSQVDHVDLYSGEVRKRRISAPWPLCNVDRLTSRFGWSWWIRWSCRYLTFAAGSSCCKGKRVLRPMCHRNRKDRTAISRE